MNLYKNFDRKLCGYAIALFAMLLFTGSPAKAQQDPMYSQYMFNTLSVNPGYAGSKNMMNALLLTRNQWVGIEGAPKTQSLTLHTPFMVKDIGLGFSLVNDEIGPVHETSFFTDFAYRLQINEKAYLAMGLKAGFNLHSANLTGLELTDKGDKAFYNNIKNKFLPNFGAGLYYFTQTYYLGISTPRLLRSKLYDEELELGRLNRRERHFFFIGGFVKGLNENILFKPTFLVKAAPNAPVSIDLTTSFLFYDRLWAGVMARIGDSFGAILQYRISDQLTIGYAYDYTISELSSYNSGSHEFMISYDFTFRKSKLKSPRYF